MSILKNSEMRIIKELESEIVHHWDIKNNDRIFSKANHFWGRIGTKNFDFFIEIGLRDNLKKSNRLFRRALRTDKSNALLNFKRDGIILIYNYIVYFYSLEKQKLNRVLLTKNCRVVLHNSICVTSSGIFFGEYGANKNRESVPVYASFDDGRSWENVYSFPPGKIKHVHGIYFDKFSNSIWITTGDFKGECYLVKVPKFDFNQLNFIGNGGQSFRCCNLFFSEENIIWGMDSQIETSYLQIMSRNSNKISKGQEFLSPIWYGKTLEDGSAVCQSSVEIGPSVKSEYAHIYYSKDLMNWVSIAKFKKDIFPMRLFKFGVIAFSEGKQNPNEFVLFGEGLKYLDGKSFLCSIN